MLYCPKEPETFITLYLNLENWKGLETERGGDIQKLNETQREKGTSEGKWRHETRKWDPTGWPHGRFCRVRKVQTSVPGVRLVQRTELSLLIPKATWGSTALTRLVAATHKCTRRELYNLYIKSYSGSPRRGGWFFFTFKLSCQPGQQELIRKNSKGAT